MGIQTIARSASDVTTRIGMIAQSTFFGAISRIIRMAFGIFTEGSEQAFTAVETNPFFS